MGNMTLMLLFSDVWRTLEYYIGSISMSTCQWRTEGGLVGDQNPHWQPRVFKSFLSQVLAIISCLCVN